MLMSVNNATKAGINFKNTDHGKLLEKHKNYFLFLYGTVAWKKKQKFCLRSLITNSYRFREFLFKMENGDKSWQNRLP